MSINPSIQKLAELIQARQEYGEPPYVLLLGSSLSLTPAVWRIFAGTEDWPGYQTVARLADAGYFNLILTLNVDDTIDDAAGRPGRTPGLSLLSITPRSFR